MANWTLSPGGPRGACSILALAFLWGCGGDAPVVGVSKVRENGRPVTVDKSISDRFFVSRKKEQPQGKSMEAVMAELIKWQVPEGWQEMPSRPLRVVNLKVGNVECYVSFLTGGGVASNLNRWRQQMGQGPLTNEEIAKLEKVKMFGKDAHLLDIAGNYSSMSGGTKADHRMRATYGQFPRFAMSVKMIGPDAEVVAQREKFDEFVASLEFDREKAASMQTEPGSDAHGAGGPPPGGAPAGGKPRDLAWDVPAGWTKGTGSSMRYVTFDAAGDVQCYITFLPGTVGGVLANMNRWLGEIGKPHMDQAGADALPKLPVLQTASPYLAAYGDSKGVLVVLTALPGETMFVKLTGPADAVKAQVAAFESFCKSLRKGS